VVIPITRDPTQKELAKISVQTHHCRAPPKQLARALS
jgi:hypothetical protein